MNQSNIQTKETYLLESELWVGNSTEIQLVKNKLMSIANTSLPVLIKGETGTGKEIAARMIHTYCKEESYPFVTVCCKRNSNENLSDIIHREWVKADRGTLFIKNIDLLAESDAHSLKSLWLTSDTPEQSTRIIASYCHSQAIDSLDSPFLSWLDYHCLTVELPTLANRVEDIEDLVLYYQSKDKKIASLSFQPGAWDILKKCSWPGNVKQIKRCLDKLAIQASSNVVDEKILLACFPTMVDEIGKKESIATLSNEMGKTIYQYEALEDNDDNSLSSHVIQRNKNDLNEYDQKVPLQFAHHPALDKAIVYLYNNFKKPLNMDDLARQACISPSHLSYLFKNYLGMSFKQTLLRLRIVKAMELLTENPTRHVTQVCDDVGFSDLSFFVRKFKATVGMSPGVYRDQYGHTKASPESLIVEKALVQTMSRLPIRN